MRLSNPTRGSHLSRAGSILIYVLWLSALLGLFTLSIGYSVRQKLKMIERIDARRSLRLAVESGVQRGLWAIHRPSMTEKKADGLNSVWSRDDTIFKDVELDQTVVSVVKQEASEKMDALYGLTDEESKININLLKDSEVLRRLLLSSSGTNEEESGIIADSILDWIDGDDHINAAGAENQYYRSLKRPLVPKNAPLDTLEELLYVRGVTPDIYRSLSRYLTLYGDGKVNLNTASSEILLALGMEQGVVDTVLAYRAGIDRQTGTRDDGVFLDVSELLTQVENSGASSADSLNALSGLVSRGILKVTSDYYEVQSRASRKTRQEQLTARAVIGRQVGVQTWKEVNTRSA